MSGKKSKIPTFRYSDKKKNKDKKNKKSLDGKSKNLDNKFNEYPVPNNEFIKIIPLNDKSKNNLNDSSMFPPALTNMLDALIKPDINKKEILEYDNIFKISESEKYDEINESIDSLDKLIDFASKIDDTKSYSFDKEKLKNIISPLKRLKNYVGMENVKRNVIMQVLYFLQNFDENDDMMHTVITGPPGVGKTLLAFVLGEIYYKLGVIKKIKGKKFFQSPLDDKQIDFKFNIARRSDLIGEYVGHTAIKTQKVIDESIGGALFIDEAYSLGNEEKKDIYSKECIDTINQNLTEKKGQFVVIIAGYERDLESCFFSYNEGLKRRFPFRYDISPYKFDELGEIFLKKVNMFDWKLDKNLKIEKENKLYDFFKSNYDNFKNYGGDMETLLFCSKICHSKRIFGKDPKMRKMINYDDLNDGLESFKNFKKVKDNVSLSYLYI